MFFTPLLPPGTPAPTFHLLNPQGQTVRLTDILARPGVQAIVLLFFASDWLPGDRALLTAYARAYPQFKAQGVEVLGISSTDWEHLHRLSQTLQLPFPLLFDPCARISKQYHAMLIPRFVTGRAVIGLDAAGRISLAKSGGNLKPETLQAHFQPADS